jgi:cobalt-zinc-cadmium efflux system outer membrane protein
LEQLEVNARRAAIPQKDLPLGCAEAERLMLLVSPHLHRERLRAGVARVSAEEAGRWLDPVLGAEALRILDPDPGQKASITGVSLGFSIPISGRLAVAKAAAKAEERAALIRLAIAEGDALKEFRIAWARDARERGAMKVLRDGQARLQEMAARGERLRSAGEISAAEAAAIRMAFLSCEAELAASERDAAAARRDLRRLAGFPLELANSGACPISVADDASSAPLHRLRSVPSVQLAEAEYEAREQQLRLAIREQYPDLEIGPLYGREDGQSRLGLGFSLPIPVLNRNKGAIAVAEAERRVAAAEWEVALMAAEAQVADAVAAWEGARAEELFFRESILPAAEERWRGTEQLVFAGEGEVLLLLDAQSALRDAQLKSLSAAFKAASTSAEAAYLLLDQESSQ